MSGFEGEEFQTQTEDVCPGTQEEAAQGTGEGLKLVPVVESIRYRKRAQSAEKKAEVLAEQLAQVKSDAAKMTERLDEIQLERQLMSGLAAAGVVDLEAAVLLAKSRIAGQERVDVEGCIEQLKAEKRYLFGQTAGHGRIVAKRTAGAKERQSGGQAVLERAGKKAAESGNRADLQEYLRLRRSLL